jgi:imidazole glycerol-phosphate synthase subunit HisH
VKATRLVLVDSGGSNLGSVQAAFERIGIAAPVSADFDVISAATHVVLPGVGAADTAMRRLKSHGLIDSLKRLQQPVLGVCVGMQLLFESSAEADTACLGVIAGNVRRIPHAPGIRVPHMGWNQLQVEAQNSALQGAQAQSLVRGLDGQYAYFVHSFAAPLAAYTLVHTSHGTAFSAVVAERNFFGAQFHPERSQASGDRLLRNFLELQ